MNSKLIIFDLDGTLLNSNHNINESSLEAIEYLKKKNNLVAIATGRSFQLSKKYIDLIKLENYAIVCNGSLIHDAKHNKMIETSSPLEENVKNDFLDKCKKYNSSFLAFSLEETYFYSKDDNGRKAFSFFLEGTKDISSMDFNQMSKFILDNSVYCFSHFSSDIDYLEFLSMFEKYKNDLKLCNVSTGFKGFVDIYGYGVSKVVGFEKLIQLLEINNLEDVYYFGDSMNDYDMFKKLSNTIAMGNAVEPLKKIAKHIIGDNNSNSIKEFIIKHF